MKELEILLLELVMLSNKKAYMQTFILILSLVFLIQLPIKADFDSYYFSENEYRLEVLENYKFGETYSFGITNPRDHSFREDYIIIFSNENLKILENDIFSIKKRNKGPKLEISYEKSDDFDFEINYILLNKEELKQEINSEGFSISSDFLNIRLIEEYDNFFKIINDSFTKEIFNVRDIKAFRGDYIPAIYIKTIIKPRSSVSYNINFNYLNKSKSINNPLYEYDSFLNNLVNIYGLSGVNWFNRVCEPDEIYEFSGYRGSISNICQDPETTFTMFFLKDTLRLLSDAIREAKYLEVRVQEDIGGNTKRALKVAEEIKSLTEHLQEKKTKITNFIEFYNSNYKLTTLSKEEYTNIWIQDYKSIINDYRDVFAQHLSSFPQKLYSSRIINKKQRKNYKLWFRKRLQDLRYN